MGGTEGSVAGPIPHRYQDVYIFLEESFDLRVKLWETDKNWVSGRGRLKKWNVWTFVEESIFNGMTMELEWL